MVTKMEKEITGEQQKEEEGEKKKKLESQNQPPESDLQKQLNKSWNSEDDKEMNAAATALAGKEKFVATTADSGPARAEALQIGEKDKMTSQIVLKEKTPVKLK